ncbi:MAG: hypothetical protein Q4F80_06280 [bacterium]|nr:hypothetical protein [bacterium]
MAINNSPDGTRTYAFLSTPKTAIHGATVCAALTGGSLLGEAAHIKKGIKAIGTPDTFSKANNLKKICSDSVNKLDTYLVEGSKKFGKFGKQICLQTKLGEEMTFDKTKQYLEEGIQKVKKCAPKALVKSALIGGAIYAGLSILFNKGQKQQIEKDMAFANSCYRKGRQDGAIDCAFRETSKQLNEILLDSKQTLKQDKVKHKKD